MRDQASTDTMSRLVKRASSRARKIYEPKSRCPVYTTGSADIQTSERPIDTCVSPGHRRGCLMWLTTTRACTRRHESVLVSDVVGGGAGGRSG
jgi:hypothetical protein